MKEFYNKKEREFLIRLLNMNNNVSVNLGEYMSSCVLKRDRAARVETEYVTIVFNIKNENEYIIVNDIQIIVSLIESLKNDNLIFIHSNNKILEINIAQRGEKSIILTSDKGFQAKIYANSDNYRHLPLSTTISEYIKDYVGQFCYIRPELIDYIGNNFQTPDQVRFRKTLFWTRLTAFFAFIGLLAAIIIPFATK
ncbi:MAG: hypothetical protein LBD10_06970 [Desulfobulbus sp.]|jgi:hypothetical protein|uniref:hypothetical protein n=1 Tax=Desulfobulbus sp. TaxID=895 RepID=UPI0028441D40|nr:hypothetical protein [Desulfobulbus sp.]MDR2549921.1 hypothetical protein [Desulfobulbus sp.]